jgi:DtxR family Mn-dependent transcriptional regulator
MTSPKRADLSESLEDYLEVIADLAESGGKVRSSNIADRLNVKRPSVTSALRQLSEKGLIKYRPYLPISLTAKGARQAHSVQRRHGVMHDFLTRILGVQNQKAEEIACRLEHAMDKDITDRLIRFIKYIDTCPKLGDDWLAGFQAQCHETEDDQACQACLNLCLKELKENESCSSKAKKGKNQATLAQSNPGDTVYVKQVVGPPNFRRRTIEMGFSRGTAIRTIRVAPLGDPIEVEVKGYRLSLRKSDAQNILTE